MLMLIYILAALGVVLSALGIWLTVERELQTRRLMRGQRGILD